MILVRRAEEQQHCMVYSAAANWAVIWEDQPAIPFWEDDDGRDRPLEFFSLFFCWNIFLLCFQAKAGFILNIVGVLTINIGINTWGVAMFQLNTFPSWANATGAPWKYELTQTNDVHFSGFLPLEEQNEG